MCILFFALNQAGKFKLVIASNRDEDKTRPSQPASFWEDHVDVLGGRDLVRLGTWLALSKKGKIGALTNYWVEAKMKEQNEQNQNGQNERQNGQNQNEQNERQNERQSKEELTDDVPGPKTHPWTSGEKKHPMGEEETRGSPKKARLGSPGCQIDHHFADEKGQRKDQEPVTRTKYQFEASDAPSRGNLIRDFLVGGDSADEFMENTLKDAEQFNGFNLLLFQVPAAEGAKEAAACVYFNNVEKSTSLSFVGVLHQVRKLQDGTYGVSNSTLNNWPKVQHGLGLFREIYSKHEDLSEEALIEELFTLMSNKQRHTTGASKRETSSIFVDTVAAGAPYGTRTQSIILVDHNNRVSFTERDLNHETQEWSQRKFEFEFQA